MLHIRYHPLWGLRPSLLLLIILILAQACAPQATPTPFRPPTQIISIEDLPTITPIPTNTIVPTFTVTPVLTGPCTNNLTFVDDVTIEDNTTVPAGSSMDKQWLVSNSGTCNWDSTYRLKWISGETFGAAGEQMLFPARAGTQAILRIIFTAPAEVGFYESAWQAVDSNGNVFGDFIFIKVSVTQ
ncbi:MAG: hypothetical protein HZB50_01985 [Chloroflexi bacterium]|nr:hypothetical protein [Chloroflexota bacterium]